MNRIKDAKKTYDEIPVPPELNRRIAEAIDQSASQPKASQKSPFFFPKLLLSLTAAAAAFLLVFTVALNTSTTFAMEMQELPLVGSIARLLTFRSYETETDYLNISVDIPSLEIISAENTDLPDQVNQEILRLCEEYVDGAIARAEEYQEAFLATGGTMEEWESHNLAIQVSYKIKSQSDRFLSFTVEGSENWASAYYEKKYYNIDLSKNQLVSLEELLGENYIETANQSILTQMEQRQKDQQAVFFTPEQGGFTGITSSANFYINASGNPVIVFGKYEIAPGSAGEVEFEIIAP